MQIQSQTSRRYIFRSLLNFVPDVLIASVTAYFVDDKLLAFLGVLIGLQIIYFMLWAKNSLWAWLMFKVRDRKMISEIFFNFLRDNEFPEPDPYLKDTQSYLIETVENSELKCDLRVKAAAELGAINYIRTSGQMQQFIRVCIAYEDAIQQYDGLLVSEARRSNAG